MKKSENKLLLASLLLIIPFLNACKDLDESRNLSNPTTDSNDIEEQVEDNTPFYPVQINSAPQNQFGYPGEEVTFSVTATSEDQLSYQWFHNSTPLDNELQPSLTFTIENTGDAGTYSVEVSNRSTQQTTEAQLTIGNLPTIVNDLTDVSVYPGETAQLSVSASGTNISYQWQTKSASGWKTLEETSNTLTVEGVTVSDATDYRVKVKNRGGEKTSKNGRITLKQPISINSQPSPLQLATGENAAFSVSASGHGNLKYQWYKNTTPLSDNSKYQGSRSTTLNILNVTASDASAYQVVVSNNDSAATSQPAELSVYGPVSITVHPQDATLYAGQNGSIHIASTGDNPRSYQWYKWTGSSWAAVSGATTPALSFSSASNDIAGVYRCTVSNNTSSATSQSATVTVLESVEITSSPNSIIAQVGDSATFSVSASGDNLQYEWTKNGQIIQTGGNTLSFASVRELDQANYSCRVFNEGSSANCNEFSLTVNAPVAILTQPSSQNTYEGGSVSLSVEASGDPAPTVEWLFGGEVVGNSSTLTLDNITLSQAGEYTCVVSNDISSVNCATVSVNISQSVQIDSQPVDTNANEGSSLTLTLQAQGENLNYEWVKDGQSLPNNSNSLSFSALSLEDAGTYSCRAWNENSSANCNDFTLTINGQVAITSQPSDITAFEDESVSLSVEHNGGPDTQVNWYFNDAQIATNTNTLTLNPLSLNQAGDYRCVVANNVNSVACTSVTVSVLEKVRITKQPSSQILSSGDTFILDIEATGEGPLNYECFHNQTLLFDTTNATNLVIEGVTSTNEGTYYCVVSNSGSETTSETANLSVVGAESRDVLVSWSAPSSRADGSTLESEDILGYSIHICPEGGSNYETVHTVQGATTEAVVELAPGVYDLTITTIDTNGLESGMSSPIVIAID